MTTALITHLDCLKHQMQAGHPERPDRLRAVLAALEEEAFQDVRRVDAPLADVAMIARAHPRAHVEEVLSLIPDAQGFYAFDPDTSAGPGSRAAILRAAGAVPQAIDMVMAGDVKNAFCAVRPPGHHAEATRVMGFCFFNNIVIGAHHARAAHGLTRIAVIDFDVHHGNGTQALFWNDKDLFYGSTHQAPFYPGTGDADEVGQGNIVNAPLAAGSGSIAFRTAIETRIVPALDAFAPEFLLISAGFDAHMRDPLGQLDLTDDDFAWVTDQLIAVAGTHCNGRVVSLLEGGYDIDALASASAAHVHSLLRA